MSTTLTAAEVQIFDAEVHHAFQAEGHMLRNCVRVKSGQRTRRVHFPKLGKGKARKRGAPQSDMIPANLAWTRPYVDIEDWYFTDFTDAFLDFKTNVDERKEFASSIANGLGRRADQLIIDVLIGSATTNTVSTDIGGVGTNLNVEKIIRTRTLLNKMNVPKQDRYFLVHASSMEGLLNQTKATSSDYAAVKALVRGEIDTFLGFKFIEIGDMDEGGLPFAAGVRTNFAWWKKSVGLAEGLARSTEVNYRPGKASFQTTGFLSAGAVEIDAEGVVKVSCTE